MPVYDYKCRQHGIFNALATLDDSGKPGSCPVCGELAPRIILIAPEIFKMAPAQKRAHEVNEKNQHEPLFSTKEKRNSDHRHSKACGCAADKGKSKLLYTARGEKMFPSMRPWMISH